MCKEAYGFIHEGCFGSILRICISRADGRIYLSAIQKPSGLFPNSPQKVEKMLTEVQWANLLQMIHEANFWSLPEHQGMEGLDGWSWTVKGYKDGYHHSSTGLCGGSTAFTALGHLFVEYSDLEIPYDQP